MITDRPPVERFQRPGFTLLTFDFNGDHTLSIEEASTYFNSPLLNSSSSGGWAMCGAPDLFALVDTDNSHDLSKDELAAWLSVARVAP
jgi:hypothetical protein